MLSKLLICSRSHTTCEDTLDVIETEEYIKGGVFDGCSSGKNSKWASHTLNYAFKQFDYKMSNAACKFVMFDLKRIKDILKLDITNFESTAVIFDYDKETKTLHLRVFGDCTYFINGERFDISQNNIPDYISHHIDKDEDGMTEYVGKYPTKIYLNVDSFIICSDGIDRLEYSALKIPEKNALEVLTTKPNSTTYLERMWNLLKKNGWQVADDLSIISYTNDERI